MPKFNKSKGFQLRSGNKSGLPFKQMGSSPANFTQVSDFVGALSNKEDSKKEATKLYGEGKGVFAKDKSFDKPTSKTPPSSIKPMEKVGPKTTKVDLKSEPIKPSKTFEETSAEIGAEKKAAKKAKRKELFKEIGKGLETAGEGIARAYGKGGTGSIMTAYSQMDAEKESQKSQDILNQTRKLSNEQKIKEAELAVNDENKMPETEKFVKSSDQYKLGDYSGYKGGLKI